ncbi:uncharacterized protein LOC101857260 [Aplysia californica]|uniref:Uncharacterized protein LOC101857260 n=1 Tax=Aplysia californica TaxID=6500 RepID=A0ABM0JVM3_APLCA|nr:uncharacterized protein LOC101857260 [Aplysia californica]
MAKSPAPGSGEYPNDYIDIVNEINDFIASLDAPPLDNHSKELVAGGGDTPRKKSAAYGGENYLGDEMNIMGGGEGASRSRHASGERRAVVATSQLSVPAGGGGEEGVMMTDDGYPYDDLSGEGGGTTMPFPLVVQDDDDDDAESTGFGTYDYVVQEPERQRVAPAAFPSVGGDSGGRSGRRDNPSGACYQSGYGGVTGRTAPASTLSYSHDGSDVNVRDRNISAYPEYGDVRDRNISAYSEFGDVRDRGSNYADYSDGSSSNYGVFSDGGSSSSSCSVGDLADSDSGCYSHYHHPHHQQHHQQHQQQQHHLAGSQSSNSFSSQMSPSSASRCGRMVPASWNNSKAYPSSQADACHDEDDLASWSSSKPSPHHITPRQHQQPYSISSSSGGGYHREPTDHQKSSSVSDLQHQSHQHHHQLRDASRPDSVEQRFHQVGSSAHSLQHHHPRPTARPEDEEEEPDYQEPSNIPVSQAPLRKQTSAGAASPGPPLPRRLFDSSDYDSPPPSSDREYVPGSPSTGRHPNTTAAVTSPFPGSGPAPVQCSGRPAVRDATYSVISKSSPSPSSQSSLQKLRNRWPPVGDDNNTADSLVTQQHDVPTSKSSTSQQPKPVQSRWKPAVKEKPQWASKSNKFAPDQQSQSQASSDQLSQSPASSDQSALLSSSPRQQPVSIPITRVPDPITRVPDLSVLISELRSVSPKSEPSPSPTYTASARSESHSPNRRHVQEYSQPAGGHAGRSDRRTPTHPTRSESHSPGRRQRLDSHAHKRTLSPSHKRTLSPSQARLTNGLRCKSESPEHDYEPIENLQVEIPATPRPQTKFPHGPGRAMAEGGGLQPKHVKAVHNFRGANNDELCFKKGDIITVTQWLDGGWWEGTLNGRTGWFPSNYVKEVKADISFKNNKSGDVPVYKRESMQLYHNVVLKNVIETEKTHVTELIKVLQSYLKPIEGTAILSPPEYKQLIGNMEEIIAFQQGFLAALEECEKLPSAQRRIGGIFMQYASSVKELYSNYCSNHPKAVSILQKHRDELSKFVESQGASPPGAQALTTILSKPFTRLDKYPSLLKELERHVEESHPDRGDTQRAIAVYRNIANTCLEIRKLKEMEHEIITSSIQGWEGEEISKLGEVKHLSQVKMQSQTGEKYERILVLFPACLVMLSMSERLSSYQYEGKIPLSGLTATILENAESLQQGFEISGPMIEKITVVCGTRTEVSSWLDVLTQQLSQSGNPTPSAKPQPLQVHMISTCQPSVSTVTPAKTAQISTTHPPPMSAAPPPPHFPFSTKTSCVWSLTCLRPSPPLRPALMCREEVLKSPRAARKSTQKRKPVRTYSGEDTDWHSKNDPKVYNEDAFILQVIEAYCNSVKTRHTVNSCRIEVAKKKAPEGKAILNSPQILLAEEEKVFDETEQQERTVVDTVYALQDRVKELEQEQRKLRQELEEEKRCRKKLEILVRQQVMKSGIVDGLDGNS